MDRRRNAQCCYIASSCTSAELHNAGFDHAHIMTADMMVGTILLVLCCSRGALMCCYACVYTLTAAVRVGTMRGQLPCMLRTTGWITNRSNQGRAHASAHATMNLEQIPAHTLTAAVRVGTMSALEAAWPAYLQNCCTALT